MSNFGVDLRQSKKAVESEGALAGKLSSIEMSITSVRSGLSLGAATSRIKSRLAELASDVSEERGAMKRMQRGLADIDQKYTQTEKKLLGIQEEDRLSWNLGFQSDEMIDLIHDSNLSDTNPLKKYADKLHDINENGEHDINKGYLDKDGNWHDVTNAAEGSDEMQEFDKHKPLDADIKILSGGASAAGALWEISGSGSAGIASGSYGVGLGAASAEVEAYLTPYGAGIEVGVGLTALTASAQGSLGNEYLNLHGEAEVNVGHVGAEASANVGLLDKDGNFNPQLGVSASAEALLAEVSATVGATVAGTQINAEGSLNFGVGAHADIGLNDGVLSLDIGASLGIGVGVSLEIDFSGTVDAVSDFLGNAWTGITGLFG